MSVARWLRWLAAAGALGCARAACADNSSVLVNGSVPELWTQTCEQVVANGLCDVLAEDLVLAACSASCGLCDAVPSGNCTDANETVVQAEPRLVRLGGSCLEVALAGGCAAAGALATSLCPNTCGTAQCCEDHDDWLDDLPAVPGTDCASAALQGACSDFAAVMRAACPLTCELGCSVVEEEDNNSGEQADADPVKCMCGGVLLEADESGKPPPGKSPECPETEPPEEEEEATPPEIASLVIEFVSTGLLVVVFHHSTRKRLKKWRLWFICPWCLFVRAMGCVDKRFATRVQPLTDAILDAPDTVARAAQKGAAKAENVQQNVQQQLEDVKTLASNQVDGHVEEVGKLGTAALDKVRSNASKPLAQRLGPHGEKVEEALFGQVQQRIEAKQDEVKEHGKAAVNQIDGSVSDPWAGTINAVNEKFA